MLRDGEPMDLTPKVFDILVELVEKGGRVVEKKELMDSIWPESFVEESNLTQHISTLRKKLGQGMGQQRYILTVPGRGYRFVVPVKSWDDDAIVTVQERIRSRIVVRDHSEESDESALETVQTQRGQLPASTRGGFLRRHRIALVVVGLILTTGIVLGWFALQRRLKPPPFANAKLTRFTTDGKVVRAAISPNGKKVAYALLNAGQQSLWVRQVGTSNTGVEVIPSSDVIFDGMVFSPDNDYLYYLSGKITSPMALYRIPALGGMPSKLVEDIDTPPAFSPDGKRIAYVRGYPDKKEMSMIIANNDGSGETKVVTLQTPRNQFIFGASPAWSPDGQTIACAVGVANESEQFHEVYQVNTGNGQIKPVTNSKWLRVGSLAWLRDGGGLMMSAADSESALSQLWYVSHPSGEARKITNDLNDYHDLTMSADSRVLAVVQSDQRSNIWASPTSDGRDAQQITSTNYDGLNGLTWTADGRLLYAARANGSENLWLVDREGKQRFQLTERAGNNSGPAISPDGRTIVFVSTRDGKQHLWRMNTDGTNVQVLTNGIRESSPSFSRDGQWIVYRSFTLGNPNIFKIPVLGGQPVRLTEGLSGPPALSPDGKTIACTYRAQALGEHRFALVPFAGSGGINLIDMKHAPRRLKLQWTTDGQALAFVRAQGETANLWVQPVNGGPPKQLTHFESDLIFNFAFSPDGRLALTRGRITNDVVLISAFD